MFYFDDNQCRNFIQNNFDYSVLKAYDSLIPTAYKADLFRYCYLYINGGVYIDCKHTITCPLSELIDKDDQFLSVEDLKSEGRNGILNSFMCSIPRLSFFQNMISEIVFNCQNKIYNSVLEVTGPLLAYKHLKCYNINSCKNNDILISKLFSDVEFSKRIKNIIENNYSDFYPAVILRRSDNKIILYKEYPKYYAENYSNKRRYGDLFYERKVYR